MIPNETLREDVARVVEHLGRTPKSSEYEDLGDYSAATISIRFGHCKWRKAMQNLGYEPTTERETRIPDDELRADVQHVVDELGHAPSIPEYQEHGEYAYQTIANRFGDGDWNPALRELGYEPQNPQFIPDETLKDDLQRVVDEVGHTPTTTEYADRGEYAPQTIANRFGDGSWPVAMDELGH